VDEGGLEYRTGTQVREDLGLGAAELLAAIRDAAHPVGSHYIQFAEANGTFSAAKSPSTLFGGTWTLKFNTESVFFRTEGALSAAERSGGVQGDAIRNITAQLGGGDYSFLWTGTGAT